MATPKASSAARVSSASSAGSWTVTAVDPKGQTVLRETFKSPSGAVHGSKSGVATLLTILQTASVQDYLREHDALAAARARGMKRQLDLLDEEGGALGAQEVADLLGISRQAVDLRRASGKLLAIDLGLRKNLYPRWQFTEEGILAGLEEALAVLRAEATTPWSCLRFFLSGNLRLDGDRPLDRLRRGETAPVLRAAKEFDTHGSA